MRGRKLSLEEVLKLEDGYKVWVEPIGKEWELYKNDPYISTFTKDKDGYLDFMDMNGIFTGCFDYDDNKNITDFTNGFECGVYKFIETPLIVHNLAQEICNLRSLDLTDENIEMIIEEFS